MTWILHLRVTSQSCMSVYLRTCWGTASNAMYMWQSNSVDTVIGKLCRQVSRSLLLPPLYQRYEKGYLSSNRLPSRDCDVMRNGSIHLH